MTNKTFIVEFKDVQKAAIKVSGKGRQSVAMKLFGCRVAKAVEKDGIKSIAEIKPCHQNK